VLTLNIVAHATSEEPIEIGLKNMGSELLAELPGQEWQGPTVLEPFLNPIGQKQVRVDLIRSPN